MISAGIATWQASKARKARKETAQSAVISADAARRSADAAEKSVALQEAQARAAEPPKFEWRILHKSGQTYFLLNTGTETATGVIGMVRPAEAAHGLPNGAVLAPRQRHPFSLEWSAHRTQSVTEVWLRWDGQTDEVAVPIPKSPPGH